MGVFESNHFITLGLETRVNGYQLTKIGEKSKPIHRAKACRLRLFSGFCGKQSVVYILKNDMDWVSKFGTVA